MNVYRGYYSILQFCPDQARRESANVGVALLCPDLNFFRAQVGSTNYRVTRFFEKEQYDIGRLNAYKDGLVHRLNSGTEVSDKESFTQFAAMQVNAIVMTPPQFCRVEGNGEEALKKLFNELVGESHRKKNDGGLRQRLRSAFESRGLLGTIVQENVKVNIPAFGREAHFPFAWQNGVLNLVDPVRFTSSDQTTLEQSACRRAIEGLSLQRTDNKDFGPCALNVVGQFKADDSKSRDVVKRILSESNVELVESALIEKYMEKIRKTGKTFKTD